MSDTPRTEKAREQYRRDVYEPNPTGFVVAEPVHSSFARELERENNELLTNTMNKDTENSDRCGSSYEKEIAHLKAENDKLRRERQRDALLGQAAMEDNHSLITELRRDVKLYRGELVKLVQSTNKLIEENES